jgi:hypothetical protein
VILVTMLSKVVFLALKTDKHYFRNQNTYKPGRVLLIA